MSRFTVIHVGEDRLDETLPLVRMAAPLLSPLSWRSFVRSAREDGGGVLAAYAADGRPHGIAAYRSEESLVAGKTLRIDPMITFEINRSAPARAALCQALELLASAKGCESLTIVTASRGYADPHGVKAEAWARVGMELAFVGLVKRLDPMPRASRAGAQ